MNLKQENFDDILRISHFDHFDGSGDIYVNLAQLLFYLKINNITNLSNKKNFDEKLQNQTFRLFWC